MKSNEITAVKILENVEALIAELEEMGTAITTRTLDWNRYNWKYANYRTGKTRYVFKMDAVYEELSIFDWWNDTLSMSQLKKMKKFLKEAIKLGFTGYVCFKVGATGCSNGMWAHKELSTDGCSPKEGACLYHSFTPDYNEYEVNLGNGWIYGRTFKTAKELEKFIAENKEV